MGFVGWLRSAEPSAVCWRRCVELHHDDVDCHGEPGQRGGEHLESSRNTCRAPARDADSQVADWSVVESRLPISKSADTNELAESGSRSKKSVDKERGEGYPQIDARLSKEAVSNRLSLIRSQEKGWCARATERSLFIPGADFTSRLGDESRRARSRLHSHDVECHGISRRRCGPSSTPGQSSAV